MATQQFMTWVSGAWKLLTATVTSAGAANAGQIVALNTAGQLDTSVMPTGIGAETITILASESLAAGAFVHIYNNAGTPNVQNANATAAGKEANGFVLSAFASAASATVYLAGMNTALTGLTAGRMVLGATAGTAVPIASAPSTTGNVIQEIGAAINATTISFEPQIPIVLS